MRDISNVNLFKTLGKIAGIGGIAFGLLIVIFGEVLRKSVFPTLSPEQSYNILKLLLVLTFAAAVIGVVVWAVKTGMQVAIVILLLLFSAGIVYMGNQRLDLAQANERDSSKNIGAAATPKAPEAQPNSAIQESSADLSLVYEGQAEVLRQNARRTSVHTPDNNENRGHCPNEVGHKDDRYCISRTSVELTTRPPYVLRNAKLACEGIGCPWGSAGPTSISSDGSTASAYFDNWGKDVEIVLYADEYEQIGSQYCQGGEPIQTVHIRKKQSKEFSVKKECQAIAFLKWTLQPSGSEGISRFGEQSGEILMIGAPVDSDVAYELR